MCHCPWTLRSLPPPTLPPHTSNSSFSPSWTAALWHCSTTWVVKTPEPVPFPALYSVSLSPPSLRHRSSLIRGAEAAQIDDAGRGRQVCGVRDVRWDGRVRSRADLCWGQRRLDRSLEKSDNTGYSCGLCQCVWDSWGVLIVCLELYKCQGLHQKMDGCACWCHNFPLTTLFFVIWGF